MTKKKKITTQKRIVKKVIKKKSNSKIITLNKLNSSTAKSSEKIKTPIVKSVHPWRLCPYGEHWVRTHEMHVPPSKTHPTGYMTTRHEHCARNPSGKDQLYPDEIQEISQKKFSEIKNKPCPNDLGFKNKLVDGNQYDDLIAGWTQYWNEILQPEIPLDPNVVKALIASESRFDPKLLANKRNSDSARGLTQITNETRRILGGEKGELKDHYITLTKEDLNDPSVNICAGIRWLFRKREVASSILKKQASWEETIAEFKGTRKAKTKEDKEKIMNIYKNKLEILKKCGKL